MDIEAAPEASAEDLATVLNLAREQLRLHLKLERLEEEMNQLNQALKTNAEIALPEALRAANLKEMPLGEGWFVKIKEITAASISETKKPEAFAWLEQHQLGGIIKRVITISFGRDEEKWAKKFLADCAKRKKPLNAELKEAVHSGTLTKTIKDMIEEALAEGEDPKQKVPFELFGVYQAQRAELIPPKKPKVNL